MDNLDAKLKNEMHEILKEMEDLYEKKYRYLKESGIDLDDTMLEIHDLNLQISADSCHYHLLQGFIAGMNYSCVKNGKPTYLTVPQRYTDFIKEVLEEK